jgi:hypothetical protein
MISKQRNMQGHVNNLIILLKLFELDCLAFINWYKCKEEDAWYKNNCDLYY